MKKVLIFSALFLLASVSLSAQVVKGAGLWYFNGLPNVTPSVATGTEVAYSINNKALFKWNRTTSAWVAVVQDSSITNELQDLILSNDTLSLTRSDSVILMAQYRNHVWEITNLSDTTSITGDIEGDIAYTSTGDTIAFRGATAWLPFTGGGGGGTFNSFNIAGDTGSSIVTDGQTVTVAGGYGINTSETGGTVTVTADTTQLVTPSDIAALMTNWLLGATSGTPQTVSSGQTATIAAGTGMTTTAAATRTVTVAIANTGISAATYGSASQVPVFAVNAQGQLTTATNTAIQIAISQVTGLSDSLSSHPSGTGTNLRIPVWTGTASLGSSTLLQSATGQTLDANLAFRITGGTTASRPTGAAGMEYFNTSNNWWDLHNGTSWFNPARSATTNGLFTAGSVLFAHSDGTIQQNNSNFFWNNSLIRLGLGTASPNQQLEITGNFRMPATTNASQNGIIYSGANRFMYTFSYGNNGTITPTGQNIFIGSSSGNFTMGSTATTTDQSSNNLGIGRSVMPSATTAYENVFAGTFAGFSCTTCIGNFGAGLSALELLTTGSFNVANGTKALGNITTTSNNIGIGINAGRFIANGSTANQTSGTSVYIGGDTKALANGDANEIVIGYNATGRGSNTTTLGNSSITSTKAFGTFEVGTLSGTGTKIAGFTSGNVATELTGGTGISVSSGALTFSAPSEEIVFGTGTNNDTDAGLKYRDDTGNRLTAANGKLDLNTISEAQVSTVAKFAEDRFLDVDPDFEPTNDSTVVALLRFRHRGENGTGTRRPYMFNEGTPGTTGGGDIVFSVFHEGIKLWRRNNSVHNNVWGVLQPPNARLDIGWTSGVSFASFYRTADNVDTTKWFDFKSTGELFANAYRTGGESESTSFTAFATLDDLGNYQRTNTATVKDSIFGTAITTATLDFGNTAAGTVSDLTVTVTGAAVGDIVTLGVPHGSVPAAGTFFAWVSATNTVTVRFANNALVTAYDPASGSFKVRVEK